MFDINDNKFTAKQMILPVAIVSFTLALLLSFQMTQIIGDRIALTNAKTQQATLFENSQKLEKQLGALITGTQKLATEGNKNAEEIVVKLKALGVIGDPKAQTENGEAATQDAPAAQVPAATEKTTRGPVKP